ncbi:MAG TPA: flagellar hook assembly protein FlgD [Spirochaetia bacterium]|nr:flagellar hook assembly protein FlgD [Spirochaetia bacterium]
MPQGIGNYTTQLSPEDLARTTREVGFFNRQVNQGKELKKILNQEDFLNLLITELKNQDPTQPMKDREFIAQMAQFSSLEQMQSMHKEMAGVSKIMARSQAYSLLGKTVEIGDGDRTIRGEVREVSGGDYPQVLVNGRYFDVNTIKSVTTEGEGGTQP